MTKGILGRKIRGLEVKIYNYVIRRKILNSDIWFFRKCRNFLVYLVCNSKEFNAYMGKLNSDKTFYLIRDPHRNAGLFAVHSYVVGRIDSALKRGLIPVVDMQYYPNMYYTDENTIGKINWWEMCFQQPFPYTLDEVYHSQNVIFCDGIYDGQLSEVWDEEKIQEKHDIIEKYVKLNSDMEKICKEEWRKIKGNAGKILGIKCRGTDYVGLKLTGHSICPSAQMCIDKTEELMNKWKEFRYERIFVATEDEEILQALKDYFKDLIVYNECDRFGNTGDAGLYDIMHKKHDMQYQYEQLKGYLVTTYCLAECDALIAPIVNGTLGALRMNGNKYENKYIFRLGNYR